MHCDSNAIQFCENELNIGQTCATDLNNYMRNAWEVLTTAEKRGEGYIVEEYVHSTQIQQGTGTGSPMALWWQIFFLSRSG